MKKIVSVTTLLLISLLLFAAPAFAQGGDGGRVVFGQNFTLESEEKVDGDLVVFGGNVELEEESVVDGSVTVFGGNVKIAGKVDGDLTVVGGNVELEDTAVVDGDLATVGGNLDREEGAIVHGNIEGVGGDGFTWGGRGFMLVPPVPPVPGPPVFIGQPSFFSPVEWFIGKLFNAIVWTLALMAIALLVTLFLPQHTDLTARTIAQYPLLSLGVGFLTLIVGIIVGLVLILLLCLGLFVWLALAIALLFGWIAAGYLVGQRLMDALKKNWSPLWSSVIGVGLITLLSKVPCIGFLFFVILASIGLGAVILSHFGSTPYVPSAPPAPPTPPPPPAPPSPPAAPAPGGGAEPPEGDVPEDWEVVEKDEPEGAAPGEGEAENKKARAALSTNPPWAYGPFFSAWSNS